jgi:hypothetical protein
MAVARRRRTYPIRLIVRLASIQLEDEQPAEEPSSDPAPTLPMAGEDARMTDDESSVATTVPVCGTVATWV